MFYYDSCKQRFLFICSYVKPVALTIVWLHILLPISFYMYRYRIWALAVQLTYNLISAGQGGQIFSVHFSVYNSWISYLLSARFGPRVGTLTRSRGSTPAISAARRAAHWKICANTYGVTPRINRIRVATATKAFQTPAIGSSTSATFILACRARFPV